MDPIDPQTAIAEEFCPDCGTPRAGRFRFCLTCGVDYDWLDANFEPPGGPFSPAPPGGWPTTASLAAGIKAAQKATKKGRRPKTPKGTPAPEPGMPVMTAAPWTAPAATAVAAPPAAAPVPVTALPMAALGALPDALTPASMAEPAVAAEPVFDLRAAAAPVDDASIGARKPGILGRVTASRFFLPRGVAPVALGLLLGIGVVAAASTTDIPVQLGAFARGLLPAEAPAVAVVPSPPPEPSPSPEPTTETNQGPLPDVQPGPGAVPAKVTRVFDGNTIMVDVDGTESRVRYLDVVMPDDSTPDGAALAFDATQLNESIVSGNDVLLESDVTDADGAGRLLRHVWVEVDGTYQLVGAWLVASGVAQREIVEPDIAYRDVYDVAQDYAQRLALGIWGTQVAELPETGPSGEPTGSAAPSTEPEPTPTPKPTPVTPMRTYTSVAPVVVLADAPVVLDGTLGRFIWRDVSFSTATTSVRWNVKSTRRTGCSLTWRVEPDGGTPTSVDVPIKGVGIGKGALAVDTTAPHGSVVVESTCPIWSLRLEGVEPKG